MVDSEVIQRKDSGNKGHGSYHKNSQMSWIAAFFGIWTLLQSSDCCEDWWNSTYRIEAVTQGCCLMTSRLHSDEIVRTVTRNTQNKQNLSPSPIRSRPLLLCIQLGFTVNTCTISLTKLIVLNRVYSWKPWLIPMTPYLSIQQRNKRSLRKLLIVSGLRIVAV